ncbi:hypothetical protein LP414_07830 [Polaromonas sp. P1(28)-13]|nr:hypothetical protein LP414_07830 [Polaromonas sp. P1(28)-13]
MSAPSTSRCSDSLRRCAWVRGTAAGRALAGLRGDAVAWALGLVMRH